MAKRKLKKTIKKTLIKKKQKNILKKINFSESYTSLILGAIVVLIAGILLLSFGKISRNNQTSSARDISKIDAQKSNTSSTYTINPGDDLWSISENVYHDGFKWVEIAKVNNLENPGLIHVGNKLIIPTIIPQISNDSIPTPTKTISDSANPATTIVKNSTIAGNTYTIELGDDLWDIAVRAYGDGFRYPDIAKANNLDNPSLIFSGNVLQIPRP